MFQCTQVKWKNDKTLLDLTRKSILYSEHARHQTVTENATTVIISVNYDNYCVAGF